MRLLSAAAGVTIDATARPRLDAISFVHRFGSVLGPHRPTQKPRSHDTSRIAWAKLLARVGEEFPVACPTCGCDIRLRGDGR